MIHSNCHTHTVFCDGKNTAEEMVQKALSLGFSSLGFSVHSPMKIENDYAILPEKVEEYTRTILLLKEKYKDKIEIYNGIELDSNYCGVDPEDFDFVIGSVHHLTFGERVYDVDYTPQITRECIENEFDGDALSYAEKYYSDLCRFLCDLKPDVIGHFDLIEKFNNNCEIFDRNSAEYQTLVKTFLDRICDACPDSIFEVNTGAMFRMGNDEPYPAKFILKHLKKRGMKITITSDAHCTQALDFAFEKAEAICRECGFEEIYVLKNGKFCAEKLG